MKKYKWIDSSIMSYLGMQSWPEPCDAQTRSSISKNGLIIQAKLRSVIIYVFALPLTDNSSSTEIKFSGVRRSPKSTVCLVYFPDPNQWSFAKIIYKFPCELLLKHFIFLQWYHSEVSALFRFDLNHISASDFIGLISGSISFHIVTCMYDVR